MTRETGRPAPSQVAKRRYPWRCSPWGVEPWTGMSKHSVALVRTVLSAWDGVRHAVEALPDVTVVSETYDLEHALQAIPELLPDLVIAEAIISGKPVTACLRPLRMSCPGTSFLVIGERVEDTDLDTMSNLRVDSYLLWSDSTPDKTQRVLVSVIDDRNVLGSHDFAHAFLDTLPGRAVGFLHSLSPREREILLLVVFGDADKEIAHRLGLSPETVPVYIRHIREKVGARNRSHLCYLAGMAGLAPETH